MIHKVITKIKNSSFIAHISFLWHWKNFFFLLKYPFYKVYNRWSGEFCGYGFTEYDSIPLGWQKAFGKQLSQDILKAGKESRKKLHKHYPWKKLLRWEEIKEKWGGLRLYASATEEILAVLEHYEDISSEYCISCGKKARYTTSGWVEYLCEDCFDAYLRERNFSDDEIIKMKEESELK